MNIRFFRNPGKIVFLHACLVAGVFSASLNAQSVAPVDKLEDAVKQLADDIAKYLPRTDAGKELSLGSFTGPNKTVNAKIPLLLKEHLGNKNFQFVTAKAYEVKGEISTGVDASGQLGTLIEAVVRNRSNTKMITYSVVFTDPQGAIDSSAPSIPTPESKPSSTAPLALNVQQEVKRSVDDGNVFVQTEPNGAKPFAVIKASEGSPYGVELAIFNGQTLDRLDAQFVDGRAQVDIQPFQQFAIIIHNATTEHVGAHVTLDGINMFHFSQNKNYRDLGKVVVKPGAPDKPHRAVLLGWHNSGNNSTRFKVTDYGDSAAAKLGISEGVGNITVTFYRVVTGAREGAKGSPLGVGFGEAVKMEYTEELTVFQEIVGAVSVRYFRPTPPPALPPGEPKAAAAR